MIDLERQKADFRRAAGLAGLHALLGFGLMFVLQFVTVFSTGLWDSHSYSKLEMELFIL